jgi:hypothetical protein
MRKTILMLVFAATLALQVVGQVPQTEVAMRFSPELVRMPVISKGIIFLSNGVVFKAKRLDFEETQLVFWVNGKPHTAAIEAVLMVDKRNNGAVWGAVVGAVVIGLTTTLTTFDAEAGIRGLFSGASNGFMVGALIRWDKTVYLSPKASLKPTAPQ